MSYIDKSFGAGETVIARAHFPWTYVLAAWISLAGPGLGAGAVSLERAAAEFSRHEYPLTWAAALMAIC